MAIMFVGNVEGSSGWLEIHLSLINSMVYPIAHSVVPRLWRNTHEGGVLMKGDLHLVVDHKTHRLIGIFDDENRDKFYIKGDVIFGGKLYNGGVSYAKDEYDIWNIELNKEYRDCRIHVSDMTRNKKKGL